MAVNDIRVNVALLTNRKFRKLKRRVGPGALEHLVSFWTQVAQQAPSGDLTGWASSDVEDAAGWEGERGELFEALQESGFLDRTPGALTVHDWDEHQHWIVGAPKRSAAARKANEDRWERERIERERVERESGSDRDRIGTGSGSDQSRIDPDSDSGKGRAGPREAFHGEACFNNIRGKGEVEGPQ